MPTCVKCGRWYPPSEHYRRCLCGGDLETGAALRRLEVKAAERGMTLDEYQEMQHAERVAPREAEERQAERIRDAMEKQGQFEPVHWDHRPGSVVYASVFAFVFSYLGFRLTVALGAVSLVAFVALGLPWWIPVAGTMVGVVGGVLINMIGCAIAWKVLDSLAYQSGWVDRHGNDLYTWSSVAAAILLPPVLMISTSIVLLRVLP